MAEFASNAKGNLGVALGAVGTGLSALNGGLGNLLGGLGWNNGAGDNVPVNRYEVNLLNSIAARDAKIEQLEADKYTDGKLLDLPNQVYGDDELHAAEHRAVAGADQGGRAQHERLPWLGQRDHHARDYYHDYAYGLIVGGEGGLTLPSLF